MSNSAGATLRGYGKGFGIAAVVLVAAIVGHTAASAAGLPPASVHVVEGVAGGAVIGAYAAWMFRGLRSTGTERWDVMNTDVPDAIESNDYMTVVSNPDNGPGVVFWEKEVGVEIGVFDSEEIRESIWLTDDDEMDQVVELIQQKRGEA